MSELHRCAADRKCVAPEITTDGSAPRRQPAHTEKPDTICDSCYRRIRTAVEDLPRDYTGLHMSLGETTIQAGARVSSTPNPPLPIDKHKYALMQAISDSLDRAAEIVSDTMHCDPPSGKIGPRLEAAALMVATNLPKLLDAPEVECFVWERCQPVCGPKGCDQGEHLRLTERTGRHFAFTLRDLHTQARATTGEWEKVLRIPTPCGNCAAPFLYQNPTTGSVFCRSCGHEWTEHLLGLAGKMIEQRQQEEEAMEKAELEQKVADLEAKLAAAEQRAEILERGFKLAVDPDYADWPAKQFAETVLQESA